MASEDEGKIHSADETPEDKEFGLLGFIEGKPTAAADFDEDRVPVYPHLVAREFLAFGVMLMVLLVISFFFDAPLEELANPGKTPNPAKAPWYFLSLQELLHYAPPFIGGVLVPGLLVITAAALPYFRGRMIVFPVTFLLATVIIPLFDGLIWATIHAVAPDFADSTRIYGLPTILLLTISAFALAKLAVSRKMDDEKVVERVRTRGFVAFVTILALLVIIGEYFRGPEWRWVWPWQ